MTADDVRAGVAHVAALAGDDEAAHAAEDALWRDVLIAIATYSADPDPGVLAHMALSTRQLDFARWTA